MSKYITAPFIPEAGFERGSILASIEMNKPRKIARRRLLEQGKDYALATDLCDYAERRLLNQLQND